MHAIAQIPKLYDLPALSFYLEICFVSHQIKGKMWGLLQNIFELLREL